MRRVSLLPHRNTWTEIERDAVKVLECYIANLGWHRPGDVVEVPWTVGHVQFWLRKTEARRQGRDYARQVLATLVRMELMRDTGTVLKPRRQPRNRLRSYWWRVFQVVPIVRSSWQGAYPHRSDAPSVASLCRFLRSQGLAPRSSWSSRGSVQWVFAHSGPP
jgi:hypothetical protein